LHCKSKCHRTKPMHPSSSRAFQRHQEHNLKHPNLVDLIHTNKTIKSFPKTPRTQSEASQFGGSHKYKQNKLPSFIDRWVSMGNSSHFTLDPINNDK
jgi:hypothetical protein